MDPYAEAVRRYLEADDGQAFLREILDKPLPPPRRDGED